MALTVALFAALGRADAAVASDRSICADVVVQTVIVTGCNRVECDAFEPIERLLADLIGQAPSETTLRRAEARLLATRLVTTASLRCDPTNAAVVAKVAPTVFIRRVDVAGQDAFRRKDLLKRVFLRAGTPIELDAQPLVDAVRANVQVKRQLDSLARLYDQAGLDDTRIEVHATRHSATRIDLLFRIDEGLRERIDTVSATHIHEGGTDSRCPTISASRLERLIGLGAGDLLTRNTEKQIRTRLRKAFQANGFENPEIGVGIVRPDGGGAAVINVRVETERCWLIRLWSRDVPESGTTDTLSWLWVDNLGTAMSDALARGDAPWRREVAIEWEAGLPFGESGSFDRSEAARALDALTRESRARGYPFAEVRMLHRENVTAAEAVAPGSDVRGTIDFLMTFHLYRRIQRIVFIGNSVFPEKLLLQRLKTRPYGFFSGAGIFDEARLFADLGAIEAYYRDEGHFRLRFRDGGPTEGGEFLREPLPSPNADGMRRWRYRVGTRGFRVEMAAHERDLNVAIEIDEGPLLRVDELEFKGFGVLERSELLRFFGFAPGDPFRPRLLDEAVGRIERSYRERGHYRFQLQVSCVAPPDAVALLDDAEHDCRDPALRVLEHVIVRVHATEGRPVRVGAVVWRGQNLTTPHVLTRDFPEAGDLLDLDRVNQGLRLMRTLPVFNAVRVDIITPEVIDSSTSGAPDTADLVVTVEESETRFLDIAAGLRSIQRANIGRIPRWAANGTGLLVDQTDRLTGGFGRPFALDLPDILLTLELEYLDLHVAGDGGQLRIPFVAGFSLSEFLRLASFNPSYSWRRFLDTRMILTVRGIAELDRVTDPLDRLELGAESDLIVPIGKSMLAGITARAGVIRLAVPDEPCVNCLTAPPFGFGTALPQSLSEATARDSFCGGDSADPACNDGGFRPQFSVGVRWRHDSLDTPLHPTRGIMLTAATSFILDRDRFALEPRFNQFFKWEASVRGAIPLGDFILAAYARYGGSVTFEQDFLPPDERFTLGGFNGLRGFSDNGICRYDRDGNLAADCPAEFGGNVIVNGSVELRAPLLQSVGLWLGLFVDFGALAQSHETLHAASFRASTGLGVRWLLGNLIPVRVDVGFPLFARRCISVSEDGGCIREEPSAFHVDLLYPF